MKKIIFLFLFFHASTGFCLDHGFLVELPSLTVTKNLTADKFKNSDAVILLKQQGYTEGPHSWSDPFTVHITNEYVETSKIIIAKVFNNAAVEHFGSFEYEYPNFSGVRQSFKVHARIMKPDGTVWIMPDDAVTTIAGVSTGSGRKLTQKVLFKLDNLAPGDVVQIEYYHAQPYLYMRKTIFYYHDQYPVLNSNLTINMDEKVKVDYLSFPPEKVGEPEVKRIGSNISSFWVVKNLSEIPTEPFSRPFGDVSYMSTVINHPDESDGNGWRKLAKDYLSNYVDKGSIPKSFMEQIGLDPSLQNPRWADIDQAYTALRKYFTLEKTNSLHPGVSIMDDIIEDKEADASDLAYMMLKILDRWGVSTTPLLIRDKRDGIYETSVSTLVWFDRLALLVSLQGADGVFDFDRSIPSRFELPWFLNGINVLALHDTGVAHLRLSLPSSLKDHTSKEFHSVALLSNNRALDSVCFRLRGAKAENFRAKFYSTKGEALVKAEHELIGENVLKDIDTSSINDFLDEPEILLCGKGTSQGTVMAIDSFVTFHPRNHLLREFRGIFSADQRYDNIFLNEPFGYSMQWMVKAPTGYVLGDSPAPTAVENSTLVNSRTIYLRVNDTTGFIKTDVVFTSAVIDQSRYKEFVGVLDQIIQATERELTFRKR